MNLAFVAPFEATCGSMARAMAEHAPVTVLTTCLGPDGRSGRYEDPGRGAIGDAVVHRFRLDASRAPSLEGRLRRRVRAGGAALPLQERWLQERGPLSSALLEYIEQQRDRFDAFVFFDLESATTVFGVPRVDVPILAPQITDWDVVQTDLLRNTARRARGFLFRSEEEQGRVARHLGVRAPFAIGDDSQPEPLVELVERLRREAG